MVECFVRTKGFYQIWESSEIYLSESRESVCHYHELSKQHAQEMKLNI